MKFGISLREEPKPNKEDMILPFTQITKNVYLYKDYSNVFVVKKGNKAVLIDFASGSVLEHLSKIGVEQVDYILHTHHHRDQCHGDNIAVEQGIKIVVPWGERKLFSQANEFWKTRAYKHLYLFKPTYFTPIESIAVDLAVKAGDIFDWGGYQFKVVNSKGHTSGSISYVVEMDGESLAFTGDLIHSGGKTINYYDMEYFYFLDQGAIGIRHTLRSFKRLLKHYPTKLLPSHGDVINDPKADIEALKRRFKRANNSFNHINNPFEFFKQLFPTYLGMLMSILHLRSFPNMMHKGAGPTYIIFGKSNNCILLDFPGNIGPFNYNWKDLSKILKKRNVTKIDFVIPTHYHDDHVDGIPYLQKHHDVKVYAHEKIVDILENPTAYRHGCLVDKSVKVDRILKEGEVLKWDDYEFEVFHFPGQTEYHMGLCGRVDGKKVFFAADTVPVLRTGASRNTYTNFCKWGEGEGVMKCADVLLKCQPDFVATSHFGVIKANPKMLQAYKEEVSAWGPAIADIVASGNANMGFDPNWISFNPIKIFAKPGEEIKTNIVVRNYFKDKSNAELTLNLPKEWEGKIKNKSFVINAGTEIKVPVTLKVPKNADPKGLSMITANVIWNGEDKGPVPDLMVDHGFNPLKTSSELESLNSLQWWIRAIKWIKRDLDFLK